MSSDTWKSLYGKKNRPGIAEIKLFLPDRVSTLFEEFSKYIAREFGLHCTPPVYTETDGWIYSFGRSSVILLSRITLEDGAFTVQGIRVFNSDGLREAILFADKLYADGFAERFQQITAIKNEKQKQSTQRRLAREKEEIERLSASINKEQINQYCWSPKVPRNMVKKLYNSDAAGLRDEELLDDIGYAFYARCLQGRDERVLIESGKMRCHNCNSVLNYSKTLIQCECGRQYLFRDYMRSFRADNMPTGAAAPIFNAFIDAWPQARDYSGKMRLVDGLVHEFHINLNSGVKGRFVGINLIEGTKKQIEELILGLAYGGSEDNAEAFTANLQKR